MSLYLRLNVLLAVAINLYSLFAFQADFFDLPQCGEFDVVVSSMVLNSVPTPELRGEMLHGYRYNQNIELYGHSTHMSHPIIGHLMTCHYSHVLVNVKLAFYLSCFL